VLHRKQFQPHISRELLDLTELHNEQHHDLHELALGSVFTTTRTMMTMMIRSFRL
jgi:hypothetical protein